MSTRAGVANQAATLAPSLGEPKLLPPVGGYLFSLTKPRRTEEAAGAVGLCVFVSRMCLNRTDSETFFLFVHQIEFEENHRIPVYFSNPDLLWKTQYRFGRFGQGAFRLALERL